MRNYVDLSSYYPTEINFGKYNLIQTTGKMVSAQNIIDFYGKGNFVNEFTTQYTLRRNQNEYVMDSGPFEMVTNKNFLDNVNGDVLIVGLGIGLIVYPLLNDININSITILEIDQDIIDYIGGILKENDSLNKVTIVKGDVFQYHTLIPTQKFDYIYFDFWDALTNDAYDEMTTLKQLYGNNLKNSSSTIHCWCEDIKDLLILEI